MAKPNNDLEEKKARAAEMIPEEMKKELTEKQYEDLVNRGAEVVEEMEWLNTISELIDTLNTLLRDSKLINSVLFLHHPESQNSSYLGVSVPLHHRLVAIRAENSPDTKAETEAIFEALEAACENEGISWVFDEAEFKRVAIELDKLLEGYEFYLSSLDLEGRRIPEYTNLSQKHLATQLALYANCQYLTGTTESYQMELQALYQQLALHEPQE